MNVHLSTDPLTMGALRAALHEAFAAREVPEDLISELVDALSAHEQVGGRLLAIEERQTNIEEQLDRLMAHLGCDATG